MLILMWAAYLAAGIGGLIALDRQSRSKEQR